MYNDSKCINYRECANNVYENEAEAVRFQEMSEKIEGFILPKRCKDCRVKAKAYFAERKRKEDEGGGESPDFVVGSEYKAFPHNDRGNKRKQGNRFGY